MKRPNKLDYLVYSIFRWWWNPIFKKNPQMLKFMIGYMNTWNEVTNTNELKKEVK